MALKNKILFLTLAFSLAACTHIKTREQVKAENNRRAANPVVQQQSPPVTASPTEQIVPPPPNSQISPNEPEPIPVIVGEGDSSAGPVKIPKVGLILGPGGARAWAHIGVLQEFQREKIPVVAVGGIEWGSVVAGLYSNKGLANEAEWQMSKLRTEDVVKKSLMGGTSSPGDVHAVDDFLRLAFAKSKAEDAKLPFGCPAMNLAKNQVFVMNRGNFEQLLPFCLAYPPSFRSWQSNVSAIRDVKTLADYLRSRGATTIVLVNVLPPPNPAKPIVGDAASTEGVLWNEISAFYSRPLPGVDQVLTIPIGSYGLLSFDERREILQKGSEKGSPVIRQLAKRLGL